LSDQIDSYLQLIATDGSTVLDFNDDWTGLCSYVYAEAPTSGTYYIRVTAGPFASVTTFDYDLAIRTIGP